MPAPETTLEKSGIAVKDLMPRDYTVLGLLFEGRKVKDIAKDLHLRDIDVYAITRRPAFKAWVRKIEDAIVSRISRGEFGAMAIAKRHATKAMQNIVDLAEMARDERVRLQANKEVLLFAGVVPQKPVELPTFDRLLDECTGDELQAFYEKGLFPARLANKLMRIAAPSALGQQGPHGQKPSAIEEAQSLAAELEHDEAPLTPEELTVAEELVE